MTPEEAANFVARRPRAAARIEAEIGYPSLKREVERLALENRCLREKLKRITQIARWPCDAQ